MENRNETIKNIYQAITEDDPEKFNELIEANDAESWVTPYGTWLHFAAKRGSTCVVQTLLDKDLMRIWKAGRSREGRCVKPRHLDTLTSRKS